MLFKYTRTIDLEGRDAINVVEKEGGLGMAYTGACSLKMIAGVGGLDGDPKRLIKEIKSYIKNYEEGEPMNLLAYVETEFETAINTLVKFGFNILEILPGGHERYEMALMCYTHNPHEYSNEEERNAANA
jgi:hypothetical protein